MKIKDVPSFVGGKEGLKNLADILDNLQNIPGVFEWDFNTIVRKTNSCGTVGCAYGYCNVLWPDKFPNPAINNIYDLSIFRARDNFIRYLTINFELTSDQVYDVFTNVHGQYELPTTPKMVAKRIREKLL